MEKLLIGILAMASVVVASNILVQFLLLDGLLTWGAFTYPIAFLITDLMNKSYGPTAARKIVLAGFITGILCSLVGSKIMLQGDGYEYPAVALRVAFASGLAFIIAQLFDIAIFNIHQISLAKNPNAKPTYIKISNIIAMPAKTG